MAVSTTSVQVKDALNVTQQLATATDVAGLQGYALSLDRPGAGYFRFAASFSPQVTGAVTLIQIKGSATRTVRVKRFQVGGVSTANASVVAQLIRCTASGTGGTAVTPTFSRNDSGITTSATAVVTHFTSALQSTGTVTGGPLNVFRLYTSVTGTPTLGPAFTSVFPEFGAPIGASLVLRGVTDFLELQLVGGGNLSAGTVIDYSIELEETGD